MFHKKSQEDAKTTVKHSSHTGSTGRRKNEVLVFCFGEPIDFLHTMFAPLAADGHIPVLGTL